jgi:ectoine hydroxylase-related dioxygenase (phytanoyl-CoA dioxygenase family)
VTIRPPFDRILTEFTPWMKSCLDQLLGQDMVLQSFGAVCALPGTGMQPVHSDHPQLFPELANLSRLVPTYALTMVVPLCDITSENGGTAIWPSSHTVKDLPVDRNDGDDLTGSLVVMPQKSDCVIWDFRTRHCGLSNRSRQTRSYLYMTWCRTWFEDRQNFNTGIQVPLEITEASYNALDENIRKQIAAAKIIA